METHKFRELDFDYTRLAIANNEYPSGKQERRARRKRNQRKEMGRKY